MLQEDLGTALVITCAERCGWAFNVGTRGATKNLKYAYFMPLMIGACKAVTASVCAGASAPPSLSPGVVFEGQSKSVLAVLEAGEI